MLAASNVPVVIMGESGTGKELIAQLIQSESNRKNNVFVTLNCGALTETLIDSSLLERLKALSPAQIIHKVIWNLLMAAHCS